MLASCALHNYLRCKCPSRYTPPGSIDRECLDDGEIREGEWRNDTSCFQLLINQGGNRYSLDAKIIRGKFSTYFNTTGRVPWQEKFIS